MTLDKLKQAENLRDEIHRAEVYLRDIKHYEHKLAGYGIRLVLPRTLGTFATNDEIDLFDNQLKKDLLNTIKIHFVKKIQDAEKELEEL